MTLKLNKETLRDLDAKDRTEVNGGIPVSYYSNCQVCWTDNCESLRPRWCVSVKCM